MPNVTFVVNGERHDLAVDPGASLLSVVRNNLGLTGTKFSCLEGICGACTVLVDGEPVRSCMTKAGDVAGRTVTTIEGLAEDGRLHPVQLGFLEELGFQCGFCTPGQVMSAAALLTANADPSDGAIREAMEGNICRCNAYPRILRSIRRASELARSDGDRLGIEGPRVPVAAEAGWMPRPRRPWDLQGTPDREYFELLGDGLVVVLPPEAATAGFTSSGGAWLHLSPREVVTAFTGKVDVGQDNRTALSMLVAEELRMPLSAVRLVMGDTDVCPYDEGTFGSRSMPDAGTYLRAVAIAARDTLLALAADRWGVAAGELTARQCRIFRRGAGGSAGADAESESLGYAELVRGLRRIELAALAGNSGREAQANEPDVEHIAGVPTRKVTAIDIVTGAHRYVLDMDRPGMLYGRVRRPPSFGATLRNVDLAPALALRGLVAVAEGDFVGVAAPDVRTAAVAAESIRAEWVERSPQPSEAGIAEWLREHPVEAEGWEGTLDESAGDVGSAIAAAPVRLEATYTAAYLAHVPLETRDAIAEWDGDRLTVWTGTQRPFGVREQLAEALGVPQEDVRVIVPDTGGGFGGKHTGEAAIEAARLARAAGRPVKIRWSREEEMTWAYFRPYAVIDVRAAAGADGHLTAWEFVNTNSGPQAINAPYVVPNRHIRYQPAASPLRIGSYRALAATANTFGRESAIDELAAAAGIDPLEFRLRNTGDTRLATVLRAAAEHAGWRWSSATAGGPATGRHGMGIAGSIEKGGHVATVAEVIVHDDLRLEIARLTTAFDCGRIVNPENLRNQIEGAAAMGLGGALWEAVHFADGRILTPTLKEYRVPRIGDIPPIDVVLVDRTELPSAGAGETPIVAIAPAIANAIWAASGIRLRSMPLTPDGVVPVA